MHKTIMEKYSNISMAAVRTYIASYERSVEKLGKKFTPQAGVVKMPFLASTV